METKQNICEAKAELKGDLLIVTEDMYPTHTFRIVDSVLPGYSVWNIGKRHMPEGYLPLCRLSSTQSFPGGCAIDVDALQAIKVEGSHIILDAIGYGPCSPKEMEEHIQKFQNAKKGTFRYIEVQRMKKALPYMRKIKWYYFRIKWY